MPKTWSEKHAFDDGTTVNLSLEDKIKALIRDAVRLSDLGDPSMLNELAKRLSEGEHRLITDVLKPKSEGPNARVPEPEVLRIERSKLLDAGVKKHKIAGILAEEFSCTADYVSRKLKK